MSKKMLFSYAENIASQSTESWNGLFYGNLTVESNFLKIKHSAYFKA